MAKPKRQKNLDTPEATAKYYVNNSKLLPEVIKSREKGVISNELAGMLMMMAQRYAQKSWFYGYSYKDDMISEALANLSQNALKFNPEKSSNPFSFYTSCIHNSFLQFLGVERKHRKIRDLMLIEVGENPSFNFQEEAKNHSAGEFKNEIADLKTQIEEAKSRLKADAEYEANKSSAKPSQQPAEFADDGELTDQAVELIPDISLLEFEDELVDDQPLSTVDE